MSGIPVKNHGKKTHKVLLKKRKQICVKKNGNKWNIPYQLEAGQPGWKDEKQNWEQLVNSA